MNINVLETKLRSKIEEMDVLSKKDEMNQDEVRAWDSLKAEVTSLKEQLERAKAQEELNKIFAGKAIEQEERKAESNVAARFDNALREYIKTGTRSREFLGDNGGLKIPAEVMNQRSLFYRADPILSTTATGLVPVNVENSLSMVTGDNFTLLNALGVKFYTGLTGTHELPYMAQLNTSKPTEGGDPSTANAVPANVELKPATYSSEQSFTKMALVNYPSAIYNGIVADMLLANERKITADYFTSILATDVSVAPTASGLTYGDMLNLTKIDYNIGQSAFVTGNDVRVYLEQKAASSSGISFCWNSLNNTIAGRPAINTDTLTAKQAVFGNHQYGVVGIWGEPELVIDSTSNAAKVKVTVLTFAKPVIRNKYAFKYFKTDASCAI